MRSGFHLNNRKFLWSKYRLLDFIDGVVRFKVERIGTFIDGFAADKAANTVGQYDAFLKHLGSSEFSCRVE